MNLDETKDILARVSAVDGRELSEVTAQAWQELLSDLNHTVAVRAVKLAQKDHHIRWIEPKHILAKVPLATAELNRETQLEKTNGAEEWVACPKPSNFEDLVSFYNALRKVAPWKTEKFSGMMTVGSDQVKPQPHIRPLSALELQREIEKSAESVGWDIPEAEWADHAS